MSKSGVYVYRTRKPGAVFGLGILPSALLAFGTCAYFYHYDRWFWWVGVLALFLSGRHFGYVGETKSFYHRGKQHLLGGGRYNTKVKPWADLDPKCYKFPLPAWKWILRPIEALFILILMPVYNDKLNRANPRRISLRLAQAQRDARDSKNIFLRVLTSIRFVHLFGIASILFWWVTR